MNNRFVIVGAGWAGRTIASIIETKTPKRIIGFIDDTMHGSNREIVISNGNGGAAIPSLGHSENLLQIIKQNRGSSVIIAITHDRKDYLLSQIIQCHKNKISVYEMPEVFEKLTKKIPVQHLSHHWILPNLTKRPHNFYNLFHNLVNYLLSLLGLLFVFLPTLPVIALLIKLDSPGPIFYRQKRAGKNGLPFVILKYRTMKTNADKEGSAWTFKGDMRITQLGRWLRKYRLDELPQLLNVLKRDMALIGPRPEAVELVDNFKKEIPFYEYRYLVRPGITGWAQVNYENTCSVDGALEKLQYDLYWIKNRSFGLDLKIIFKSIKVMLTGFGTA